MNKPYIKADKLGRICAIYYKGDKSLQTPEEYKAALNMFRGRQIKTNLKECIDYIQLSTLAQGGSVEAQKALSQLHYDWNHC